MSTLPLVAIIGRPNTGKSTLFNRLIGTRRSIESDIPGTTRDMISHRVDLKDMSFVLVDTGGIGASRDKDFEADVAGQSTLAMEIADVILFTVNGKEEITADDRKVVDMIRKKRRRHVPVIVVVTKVDTPEKTEEVLLDFHEVNVGEEMIAVSAFHRLGFTQLFEAITKHLKELHFTKPETPEGEQVPRIAIIGRPNVGKSSIVNALMTDTQRGNAPLMVSTIAGTTRDSVDTEVTYQGKPYVLVDTAGLKKHARRLDELERYSMMRTATAIEQADTVILVLDASVKPTQQDKRIAAMAVDSGKGLIILLNKIDTMKGDKRKQATEYVKVALHFCSKFAKIIPCSANTREGLVKLFDIVDSVQQSRIRRIPTRELRRWFEKSVYGQPMGNIGRSKHITQSKDVPPTFVVFVKDPKKVSVSQIRFLENRLRETFGFDGTPIRWIMRGAQRDQV